MFKLSKQNNLINQTSSSAKHARFPLYSTLYHIYFLNIINPDLQKYGTIYGMASSILFDVFSKINCQKVSFEKQEQF